MSVRVKTEVPCQAAQMHLLFSYVIGYTLSRGECRTWRFRISSVMSHIRLITYYLFYLVLNFSIHIIESEFDVVVLLLLLLSVFKTVVPHETN